jgi:senataxin
LYSRLEKLCSDQGCHINETIEVNTVDAFQGSEKDIIIFNCVRSNFESYMEKSLGFLLDERRLNVAITRPKFFLMVVGN